MHITDKLLPFSRDRRNVRSPPELLTQLQWIPAYAGMTVIS
jgi:hypothetical protein